MKSENDDVDTRIISFSNFTYNHPDNIGTFEVSEYKRHSLLFTRVIFAEKMNGNVIYRILYLGCGMSRYQKSLTDKQTDKDM